MKINQELLSFLENQKAATIAVPIDDNGLLHAASLLFWSDAEKLYFYFVTSRDSEKYTLLRSSDVIPCAVVVGTEKGTDFTLQMRGQLNEVNPEDYTEEVNAYYKKRGNRQDNLDDSNTCLLQFKPSWARYTDYSKDYGRSFIKF